MARSIPLAALALVGAVWAALALAQREASAGGGAPAAAVKIGPASRTLPSDPWLGFVEIPAGPFLMGSDPGRDSLAYDIERWSAAVTPGTVDLPLYYMGRREVTVAQYRGFVEASGHPVPDPATLAAPADHPVASVSWPDAIAYAGWLDGALRADPGTPEGLAARLREGWHITLPDEAQWEKAARSGDGRVFPWGDGFAAGAATLARRGPTPAGSHACPTCAYGLADMSGNVWEWTRSPYQPYPFDAADDLADRDSEALWVIRGGSYADPDPRNLRASARGGADPGARRPFIGFRLALVPPLAPS